jgi:hypothetical protein
MYKIRLMMWTLPGWVHGKFSRPPVVNALFADKSTPCFLVPISQVITTQNISAMFAPPKISYGGWALPIIPNNPLSLEGDGQGGG